MKILSAWGMIERDDEGMLSPHGAIDPTSSEIENAVAAWNAPPPRWVRRGGTAAAVTPPIPAELRPWLNQVLAAVNAEFAAMSYVPLPLQIFWRSISTADGITYWPSRELAEATRRALARLGDSIPDDAWRKRLVMLAAPGSPR